MTCDNPPSLGHALRELIAAGQPVFRLWARGPAQIRHWGMLAAGDLGSIEAAYADMGVHYPEAERLILPDGEKPCL